MLRGRSIISATSLVVAWCALFLALTPSLPALNSRPAGTQETCYLVDRQNPTGYSQVLAEYTAINGTPSKIYHYGLDLISQHGTAVYYFGYDGSGSTRFLLNSSGTIASTYDYDVYGNLLAGSSAANTAYRFNGEQLDLNLNLYYLRARYYQPTLGRFWSMDSYEGTPTDPHSLHKYLYCGADPVNNVDPTGHETLKTKIGKEVHKKLGEIFTSNGTIPLRFSGPSIATIGADLKIPIPQKVQVLFPDLLDASRKEVYELKPITAYGLATGFFQALGYVSLLNQVDPLGGWHLGNSWYPPNFLILTSGVAYVSPPVGGVIFYEAMTITDIAKKGARTVRLSDQNRLQQHMGIATILSTLGGF